MAVFLFERVTPDVVLGVWRVEETVDGLFALLPHLEPFREEFLARYGARRRLLEVLAVRALISAMLGPDARLTHDDMDRPHLNNGMGVSVSHTRGYATVIASWRGAVAVDAEYRSERVCRVTRKFMLDGEMADTTRDKILHWCAKETLIKLYPGDCLAMTEAMVEGIEGDDASGTIRARNLRRGIPVDVTYRIMDDLLLTYAILDG